MLIDSLTDLSKTPVKVALIASHCECLILSSSFCKIVKISGSIIIDANRVAVEASKKFYDFVKYVYFVSIPTEKGKKNPVVRN